MHLLLGHIRQAAVLIRLELRHAYRQTRTWLFLLAALACVACAYAIDTRDYFQAFSPDVGIFGPLYTVASLGTHFLLLLCCGVALIAFDATGRNSRARIAEAVDSRPVSDIAAVGGSVIGLALAIWLPATLLGMLVYLLHIGANAFDWPGGGSGEPHSFFAFLFLALPPSLLFVSAAVGLIAATTRNRLAVVLLLLPLAVAFCALVISPPPPIAHAVNLVANHGITVVSALAPSVPDSEFLFGRSICVVLAAGFVLLSATSRRQARGSRASGSAVVGTALLAVGVGALAALVAAAQGAAVRGVQWIDAHRSAASTDGHEVVRLVGEIVIEPGAIMDIDVHMELAPSGVSHTLPSVLTLNPGLRVLDVEADDQPVPFTHERGLLHLSLPTKFRGRGFHLSLRASGVPNPNFAHLDGEPAEVPTLPNGQPFLGDAAVVFDRRYVGLMPGAYWLPALGSATDPPRRDFAKVTLTVDVPSGWTVAAPGLRSAMPADNGRSRFRFSPEPPVAEIGLFASDFAKRSLAVADVEFELLFAPHHMRNVELFADTVRNVASILARDLAEAERRGLAYPFRAMRVVEVPQALRLYSGGWQLDSRHSLPGMHLVPETSFPTAPFRRRLDALAQVPDRPGSEVMQSKIDALEIYFENDRTGLSPHEGFRRNLLVHHLDISGNAAQAVVFVVEALVALLFGEEQDLYSARIPTLQMVETVGGRLRRGLTEAGLIPAGSSPPFEFVQLLEGPALDDLGARPAGDAIRLYQRGTAIARVIFDDLGTVRTAHLLSDLANLDDGKRLDAGLFEAIAEMHVGAHFRSMTSGWVHANGIPGFSVSKPQVRRLVGPGPGGLARHIVLIDVHNDQPVGGAFRISYADGDSLAKSDVITLDGERSVTVGLQTKLPMSFGWLTPYISLNRGDVVLDEVSLDPEAPPLAASLLGVTESTWTPQQPSGIVVDDLDTGFSIDYGSHDTVLARLFRRAAARSIPAEGTALDPATDRWRRKNLATAWGNGHRRTVTDVQTGDGRASAVFETSLPSAGQWRLAYHMPQLVDDHPDATGRNHGKRDAHGDYELHVATPGTPGVAVTFDAASSVNGWNHVASFALGRGPVRVTLASRSDGNVVYADAIRWTPAPASTTWPSSGPFP